LRYREVARNVRNVYTLGSALGFEPGLP
jgi:hypothetical protein